MTKRARKWKMFARVVRGKHGEDWTPELSFYRDTFQGPTGPNEQIIRIEVREIRRRGKK